MRKFALMAASALVGLSLAGSVLAADDPMSGFYGNTTTVKNEKGETLTLWIAKGGKYKAKTAKGEEGTGKWRLTEGNKQYCATPDLPATAPAGTPAPKETCTEFAGAHKPGDKWVQKDAEGKPIEVEVKAGM